LPKPIEPTIEAVCVVETSLISAFIGAQIGEMQLALAARLARMEPPDIALPVSQLVNAADQSANALANVGAGIGKSLDVSA
jgi:hypothetical protein